MAELKEEEVHNIAERLKRANNDGLDTVMTEVIDQMKLLTTFRMTIDILDRSRIGLIVNTIRKNSSDEECSSLAKRLIKSWRKLLPDDDSSSNKKRQKVESEKSEKPKKSVNPEGKAAEAKSDDRDVRQKCQVLIFETLKVGLLDDENEEGNNSIVDSEILSVLASDLESAVFESIRKVDERYKNRIRSRVMNLRRNKQLRQTFIENIISAEELAIMTPEQMASDEMKKLREKFTKESINRAQMAFGGGTRTTQLKCSRCGKSDCSYNQVQTLSADEPMTTFVVCNNCGKRWKFN